MKVKAKRLVSLVCALGMCAALLPATVLADEGNNPSATGSSTAISTADGVVIDKTVTSETLDANLETDVNLSVSGTETKDKVAVLFLLDKSTSQGMRDEAAGMLDELATKTNTDIVYDVVIFSGTAKSSGWKDIQDGETLESIKANFVNGKTTSGTNMDAGIQKAMTEMNALPEGYDTADTYLITLSDGITYVWTGDDGSTKSVPVEGLNAREDAVENSAQTGADTWAMMYEYGVGLRDIYGSEAASDKITDIMAAFKAKAIQRMKNSVESNHVQTYPDAEEPATPIQTYIYNDEKTAEVAAQYACGADFAMYESATGYEELVQLFTYSYAYAVPEANDDGTDNTGNWDNYPWGRELMEYFHALSSNADDSYEVSNANAAEMFATIKNRIMYAIEDGTITDVIGSDFDVTDLDSFVLKVGETTMDKEVNKGTNTINFYAPEDAAHENALYVLNYTPGAEGVDESFTLNITVPVEKINPLNLSYTVKLVNVGSEAKMYVVPTNEKATLTYTSTTVENPDPVDFPVPQVSYYVASIEPADITIYMGGDNGYEGVAEDNGTISGSTSLPEPGYYITLPKEINTALNVGDTPIDLSDHLTISTHGTDSAMSWNLAPYGNTYSAAYNKYIYALVSETGSPFRLNFVAGDQTYTSDTFDPETAGALYNTYTMEVYPELVNNHQVTINVTNGDQTYTCIMVADTGTLNIRYVTGDQDSVVTPSYTDIAAASQADDPTKDALDKAYVIRDADTKFYVNGSDVDVSEDKGFADVSLLFDDIISSGNTEGVTDYSAEITEKAIEAAAKDFQNVQYEAKYLDLVDANNGNVWLTPSDPVTVYWPYPAGTDANTTFKLVHFDGLDRDMDLTDVENDIANAKIEVLDVKTDKYGISFTTKSFSPFVLLWDNTQTTTVTSTPAPDEHPDIAEAKANGTWGQPTPTPAATTSVVPQTSDDMPVTLLIVVAVVAAAALVVLVVVRKRRRDQ